MSSIVPDIELEIPEGWSWAQRDASPLGLQPDSESGALQISTPPTAAVWRGADLEAEARRIGPALKLGEVVKIFREDIPYGHMVRAEMTSAQFGDVAMWIISHDTHDPLLATWIADAPTDDGKVARDLVARISPGTFSRGLDMIMNVAKSDLGTKGALEYHTVLIGDGTITTAYFHGMPDEIEREAIRHETRRNKASLAARIGMANVPTRDGAVLCAFVHAESKLRKKRFVLPAESGGREAHEVDATQAPITDFFLDPDPRVVAMLEQRQP